MVHGKKKFIQISYYYYFITTYQKKKKTDLYEMYLLQMICLNMLGDHINMLW